MTVHWTSRKNYDRNHRFKWPNLILNCLKTLILNFAYIHSKRRKLGMFILCQKCQFVSKQSKLANFLHFSFLVRDGEKFILS